MSYPFRPAQPQLTPLGGCLTVLFVLAFNLAWLALIVWGTVKIVKAVLG